MSDLCYAMVLRVPDPHLTCLYTPPPGLVQADPKCVVIIHCSCVSGHYKTLYILTQHASFSQGGFGPTFFPHHIEIVLLTIH